MSRPEAFKINRDAVIYPNDYLNYLFENIGVIGRYFALIHALLHKAGFGRSQMKGYT